MTTGAERVLKRLMRPDSAVHAALMYGVEPVLPETYANRLADAWLAHEHGDDGPAEGDRAVAARSRGANPDILDIRPFGPSNAIGLAAFRRPPQPQPSDPPVPLMDFMRTAPLMSRHKVVVIHDAHRLTPETSNALLKTLEEPPDHLRLVLATSHFSRLMATIVSRCVCVACEVPAPAATDDPFLPLHLGEPNRKAIVEKHRNRYQALLDLANALPTMAPGDALMAAERFRAATDLWGKSFTARVAQTEALADLAALLQGRADLPNGALTLIAEAHRRIAQNGSSTLVFDALFGQLLAMKSPLWTRRDAL